MGITAKLQITSGLTVLDVQSAVAWRFDMTVEKLLSKWRHRQVAHPRMVAMYLAREHTEHSYPILGRLFRRDHTTVLHGVRKVRKLRAEDMCLWWLVSSLERELGVQGSGNG